MRLEKTDVEKPMTSSDNDPQFLAFVKDTLRSVHPTCSLLGHSDHSIAAGSSYIANRTIIETIRVVEER